MAMALSNMFRYSIKTKNIQVSLGQELEHVKNYISIQQVRYKNRFHFHINISEHLYECQVLKLILQPLVETSDLLILTVEDNGVGIPDEQLTKLQQELKKKSEFSGLGTRNDGGIGIQNINTRLALFYGEEYGLKLESHENHGTTVTLILPLSLQL